MSQLSIAGAVRRTTRVCAAVGLLATLAAGPVAAAGPAVSRDVVIGFHVERHFDGDPVCGPGVTEIQEGNTHFMVVDDGTWLNVAFGSTYWVTVVPDDPALPVAKRQVTGAGHYRLQRDGDEVWHESFHDFGPYLDIFGVTTFTTKDGEVHVDHTIQRDAPPPGC